MLFGYRLHTYVLVQNLMDHVNLLSQPNLVFCPALLSVAHWDCFLKLRWMDLIFGYRLARSTISYLPALFLGFVEAIYHCWYPKLNTLLGSIQE